MSNLGVVCKIYPNKKQIQIINNTIGCARLVYNLFLNRSSYLYEKYKKSTKYNEWSSTLTNLKDKKKHSELSDIDRECFDLEKDYDFLQNVSAAALQQSLRDLEKAFNRFFDKISDYPKYKAKHGPKKSYRIPNQESKTGKSKVYFIDDKHIYIPCLGSVKINITRPIEKINNITVSLSPSGDYYVSINTEKEMENLKETNKCVGIDLGLKKYLTDSNNKDVDNPRKLRKNLKKLRREQRKLSRRRNNEAKKEKEKYKKTK